MWPFKSKKLNTEPVVAKPTTRYFMTAEELKQKYSGEYLVQQKKEYEEKNAKYLEDSVTGQLNCNQWRIDSAIKRGENFYEIDSRNNCCLNDYGMQRYRELGYTVKIDEYDYVHDGRNKKYKVYTISW